MFNWTSQFVQPRWTFICVFVTCVLKSWNTNFIGDNAISVRGPDFPHCTSLFLRAKVHFNGDQIGYFLTFRYKYYSTFIFDFSEFLNKTNIFCSFSNDIGLGTVVNNVSEKHSDFNFHFIEKFWRVLLYKTFLWYT